MWGVRNSTPLLSVVPSRPSLLVEGARGLWVCRMECLYYLRRVAQVCCIFPAVVFRAPTLPVYEVLQLLPPPITVGLKHYLYFVLLLPFDFY